jgi:hypothetical protein
MYILCWILWICGLIRRELSFDYVLFVVYFTTCFCIVNALSGSCSECVVHWSHTLASVLVSIWSIFLQCRFDFLIQWNAGDLECKQFIDVI